MDFLLMYAVTDNAFASIEIAYLVELAYFFKLVTVLMAFGIQLFEWQMFSSMI